MSVDPEVIEWLKKGAIFVPSTDAGVASAWGEDALETEIVSPIALAAAAATEAGRQQAFLEGPLAVERHVVKGLKASLIGRPVTLTIAALGYDSGLDVFVIGVEEAEITETTTLTVLRRLA